MLIKLSMATEKLALRKFYVPILYTYYRIAPKRLLFIVMMSIIGNNLTDAQHCTDLFVWKYKNRVYLAEKNRILCQSS